MGTEKAHYTESSSQQDVFFSLHGRHIKIAISKTLLCNDIFHEFLESVLLCIFIKIVVDLRRQI